MATRDEWPCYDDKIGTPIHALKKGRELDGKDIEVLVALYQQLVAGDLLGRDWGGIRTTKIVIRLATQEEHDIIPSDEFLQRVSVDSLVAVAATESRDTPRCELQVFAWLAPDTAVVDATVMRHGTGVNQGGLVVRRTNGWTVCPARGIGIIN